MWTAALQFQPYSSLWVSYTAYIPLSLFKYIFTIHSHFCCASFNSAGHLLNLRLVLLLILWPAFFLNPSMNGIHDNMIYQTILIDMQNMSFQLLNKNLSLALSQCISTLLMLCTSDMYTLINYVGFINYLFYGVTVAGQIVLRIKQPDIHRPIKVSPKNYWNPVLNFMLCWTKVFYVNFEMSLLMYTKNITIW